ncbi:MAG: glycosyltransferase family 4 protein [Clostridiaceae bacterium]|nr:glycosyltransferase family 4 protein [Clostridiaceae bacterium]
MKKKVFILGNFGYWTNKLNGQSMRTRTVYEALKKNDGFNIKYTDTSVRGKKIEILSNYLRGLFKWVTSKYIILLPAQKAIKFTLPFFCYFNILFRKSIHFIAIGGWLSEFLQNNQAYVKYFKNVNFIYVQTKSLKKRLEEFGLENVVYFPNFRLYKNNDIKLEDIKTIKKAVFFSRVTKDKGVEIAIKAINKINKDLDANIQLHVYGPIEDNYIIEFEQIINQSRNIYYNGVLDPDVIISTLSLYDFLIFPTYYEGEGFPGAILDAMTSGVPIVASDWKYNSEVLKDGHTGLLFKSKDIEDLIKKMKYLIENPKILNQMKKECILESEKYKDQKVVSILLKNLQN